MPLFGTDGIRGVANEVLTPILATKLGKSLQLFTDKGDSIVIGMDTRNSGSMLSCSLASGISSVGRQPLLVDVIPTPAVPILMNELDAKVGVMISASHNYASDNGIKFFNSQGYKFSPSNEHIIEEEVYGADKVDPVSWDDLGDIKTVPNPTQAYLKAVKRRLDNPPDLSGLKIGLDCAHGAAYKVAPQLFSEFGASLDRIGVSPTGKNINQNCGSTSLGRLKSLVKKNNLDLGIAFDGDGDRVLLVDEKGQTVDGDKILYMIAGWLERNNELNPPIVVATVMSNIGLERALSEKGISLLRTQVGDKHVAQEMETNNALLGGEQSGHIIFSQVNTTGDGMVTAVKVLKVLTETGKKLSVLQEEMERYPQVLENVPTKNKERLSGNGYLQGKIQQQESELGDTGRILVRPSGTQDVVRVMVEAASKEIATQTARELADIIDDELN